MSGLILTFVLISLLILLVAIWSDQEQRRALKIPSRTENNGTGTQLSIIPVDQQSRFPQFAENISPTV